MAKQKTEIVKTDAKAKGGKAKPVAVTPEVLPPEQPGEALMVKPENLAALTQLEASIQRDIGLGAKLDKAGAMVSIRVGLALKSAKGLLKHGQYENWIKARFGEAFSERKAQYAAKLATAFLKSAEGGKLVLPPPKEAGSWLVVADEGSALQTAVEVFVGDDTLAELLDKYRIRPVRRSGGWQPSEWVVRQYQQEHPHLQNKAFADWPQADRDAFMEWQKTCQEGDSAAQKVMAAESSWQQIRDLVGEHAFTRKSHALLPREQLERAHDVLSAASKELRAALKEG